MLPVISAFMSKGVPEGEPVVLDVAQLEALLSRTFGIGLDVGRGKEPVALVRLRATAIVTGLAAIEPDPRAPSRDVILDAALQAATGLQQLLSFRHACTTATSPADQQDAAELGKAAEAACGLIELARLTAASGRTGTTDLS